MTAFKLIGKLLKFKGFRCVGLAFRRGSRLDVLVKPYKNGCRCPECGRRGKIIRQRPDPRFWRDIPVGPWSVWLMYWPREIRCATHGRVTERLPWADAGARVSYRLEYLMLRYGQIMSQKAAAELLRLPTSTLSNLVHRLIERLREGHRIRGLKTIGIDEISYHKGHKYATLVYDLDRSCVVWIGQGKGRETIDQFFNEALSDYQKARIQAACCDMSQAYIGAIKDHCPNATLVLDRFHIVKALNEAVDEVRKQQWREASKNDRKALKGLRWLLYRHSSTRTRRDTQNLKALDKHNRRIYRAWRLKEEFERFWDYKATWAAERFLKQWTKSALLSRLEPMRNFVRTLRKNQKAVVAFIDTRVTNAIAEGINRIVRIIKNRASGYRHLEAFSDMIYLAAGDLDLPEQIPARFRTL
ncbi:MAG: ISL3 family transposase [Gammaproteobacteria bacterium]|jgi:transposase|nr:ISL3 family transposase [Gammaproteobacteria bacterium]